MSQPDYRKILSLARAVQHGIKLTRWNAAEFERLFGARSAKDILSSGKTSYLNPCLDQTTVFIHFLKEKGYDPQLIVEERVSSRTTLPTLHFAVEIPLKTSLLTIDFVSGNHVAYYAGEYDPQKSAVGRKTLQIHKFSTRELRYTTSLNRLLGLKGTRTLYKRFTHVTPQAAHAVFETMGKMDTPRLYTRLTSGPKRRRKVR